MNKKLWILLLPVVLLACNFLFPQQEPPAGQAVPTINYRNADNPEIIEEAEAIGFTIVRIHPGDVDVQTMIASEAQKAIAAGLIPVVEFDATWCPPCQAIDKSIKEKNQLMLDAYKGTYIIKMDVDEWVWDNGRVENFVFDGIPVYFKLSANGEQTGEVIDGNAWGDNIPENMAPPMDTFFHEE